MAGAADFAGDVAGFATGAALAFAAGDVFAGAAFTAAILVGAALLAEDFFAGSFFGAAAFGALDFVAPVLLDVLANRASLDGLVIAYRSSSALSP